MAKIVAVHGIGNQFNGSQTVKKNWWPALQDGLSRAGIEFDDESEFNCAFYGDLFRKSGGKSSSGVPPYSASNVETELEQNILLDWYMEAMRFETETTSKSNAAIPKGGFSKEIKKRLYYLCDTPFFNIAERFIVNDLKQVSGYLENKQLAQNIKLRVSEAITPDTTVLVAHSLGSVVAYEVLCEKQDLSVKVFVTLGSPLGIPMIFDRLVPHPIDGVGVWPGNIVHWVNIADRGDIVAMTKKLNPLFSGHIDDKLVHNGSKVHDAQNYFTSAEVGEAIALGLST